MRTLIDISTALKSAVGNSEVVRFSKEGTIYIDNQLRIGDRPPQQKGKMRSILLNEIEPDHALVVIINRWAVIPFNVSVLPIKDAIRTATRPEARHGEAKEMCANVGQSGIAYHDCGYVLTIVIAPNITVDMGHIAASLHEDFLVKIVSWINTDPEWLVWYHAVTELGECNRRRLYAALIQRFVDVSDGNMTYFQGPVLNKLPPAWGCQAQMFTDALKLMGPKPPRTSNFDETVNLPILSVPGMEDLIDRYIEGVRQHEN